METDNRKHTWVHITYERDGHIEIYFVTDRWKSGKYVVRHRRLIKIERSEWTRMACLLRTISYSANVKYTIFAWNGYSVSYERRLKP